MHFARGLELPNAEHFVSMYVNEWTLDYGERGRQAVQSLLDRGYQAGIIPQAVKAEFVSSVNPRSAKNSSSRASKARGRRPPCTGSLPGLSRHDLPH